MIPEGMEDNDIGKHRFSLCCILNLHVLSNIMLPSMCAFPFCAINFITCFKKRDRVREREISPRFKKKKIKERSLQAVQRLIISLWEVKAAGF